MRSCTFFGHADVAEPLEALLESLLRDLIEEDGIERFYVGNHGNFDASVARALKKIAAEYPQIQYCIVLAYLPQNGCGEWASSLYPEGMEYVPPRFAIDRRNKWMLAQCDTVVAYITHQTGGAARYVRLAKRQGKRVLYLAAKGESITL